MTMTRPKRASRPATESMVFCLVELIWNVVMSNWWGAGRRPLRHAGPFALHHLGGKQIWATEFGEPTSKVDEATQAAWIIQDFITIWRTLPGVHLHHPRPQHRQQQSPGHVRRVSSRLDAQAGRGREPGPGLGSVSSRSGR